MISNILVALDDSGRAPGVFRAAAEIASRFGARLTPVRAIVVPPEVPAAARASLDDPLPAHLQAAALAELRELARPLAAVQLQQPIVAVGQPWRASLDCADSVDADLIVIGSHGYHAVDRVLGTTAGKVANVSHRNVLVVNNREAVPAQDAATAASR